MTVVEVATVVVIVIVQMVVALNPKYPWHPTYHRQK